jgi:hypothetical protein
LVKACEHTTLQILEHSHHGHHGILGLLEGLVQLTSIEPAARPFPFPLQLFLIELGLHFLLVITQLQKDCLISLKQLLQLWEAPSSPRLG